MGSACFVVVATILPFHKDESWWVRACDFPRLQIATLTAITLAGILAFTEPNVLSSMLAFALLGCLGVQLAVILPYTPLAAGRGEKNRGAGRTAHPQPGDRQRVHAKPPDRPAEGHHPGTGSRSGPRGRDRRVVVRAPGGRFAASSVPDRPSAAQHLWHDAAVQAGAGRSGGALPAQAGYPFDPHRRAPALRRRGHAVRPAPGAAEPDRSRHLAAARRRARHGRPRDRAERPADARRRRSQRRGLVAHQPAVPPHRADARPARRSGRVQHVSRALLVSALAARPRLRQQHFPAAPPAASPRLRLRPFSDLHRAGSCACGQRGAGGARAGRGGPRRSARQAAARGSDRGRSTGAAIRRPGYGSACSGT